MTLEVALLILNAASTWFMVGLIWFVQCVHYPMFAFWPREQFRIIALEHQKRTSRIVIPPIIVEFITSWLLLIWHPAHVWNGLLYAGVGSVMICAASTAFIQVPLHDKLAKHGWDESTHRKLVRSNWIRTIAWSIHGLICCAMLASK